MLRRIAPQADRGERRALRRRGRRGPLPPRGVSRRLPGGGDPVEPLPSFAGARHGAGAEPDLAAAFQGPRRAPWTPGGCPCFRRPRGRTAPTSGISPRWYGAAHVRRTVAGVEVLDHRTNRSSTIAADLVGQRRRALGRAHRRPTAGVEIPLQPGPASCWPLQGRLTGRVVNRLQPAGEGTSSCRSAGSPSSGPPRGCPTTPSR